MVTNLFGLLIVLYGGCYVASYYNSQFVCLFVCLFFVSSFVCGDGAINFFFFLILVVVTTQCLSKSPHLLQTAIV